MDSLAVVDYSRLAEYFRHGSIWCLVGLAVVFGALGGFVHRYAVPAEDRGVWYGGVLMGAAGAIAFMFVMIPTEPLRFLAVSLVAGFGGKAIIESILETINSKIVRRNTVRLISRSKDITADVKAVLASVEDDCVKGRIKVSQDTLDKLKEFGLRADDKQKELKSLQARAGAK